MICELINLLISWRTNPNEVKERVQHNYQLKKDAIGKWNNWRLMTQDAGGYTEGRASAVKPNELRSRASDMYCALWSFRYEQVRKVMRRRPAASGSETTIGPLIHYYEGIIAQVGTSSGADALLESSFILAFRELVQHRKHVARWAE